jgi:hypothetical protein
VAGHGRAGEHGQNICKPEARGDLGHLVEAVEHWNTRRPRFFQTGQRDPSQMNNSVNQFRPSHRFIRID